MVAADMAAERVDVVVLEGSQPSGEVDVRERRRQRLVLRVELRRIGEPCQEWPINVVEQRLLPQGRGGAGGEPREQVLRPLVDEFPPKMAKTKCLQGRRSHVRSTPMMQGNAQLSASPLACLARRAGRSLF